MAIFFPIGSGSSTLPRFLSLASSLRLVFSLIQILVRLQLLPSSSTELGTPLRELRNTALFWNVVLCLLGRNGTFWCLCWSNPVCVNEPVQYDVLYFSELKRTQFCQVVNKVSELQRCPSYFYFNHINSNSNTSGWCLNQNVPNIITIVCVYQIVSTTISARKLGQTLNPQHHTSSY